MSFYGDQQPVILSAVRTPIGSFCGSLSSLQAHELGAACIKKAVELAGVKTNQISEVIYGQVLTAGHGQNPVRQASINAGIPNTVPATTISMVCGSGLRSVILGAQAIKLGDAEVVVTGGQESMSQSHHSTHLRNGTKMGNATLLDTMVVDGLTDAFKNIHMGITAENIAAKYSISREEQDVFAYNSQRKAGIALNNNVFKDEIVPIEVPGRKGAIIVSKDEYPKPETTLEGLKNLRPAFIRDSSGTVTAGNASGINDGAAAIIVSSLKFAKSEGLRPLANIVAYASSGVDPSFMGMGPVTAVQSALKRAGWNIQEVDLYELNEAFASQSLAVVKELGVDPEKVNINGGAIALGHPIGASGGRILVTLLHALKRTGGKKGVAALCIGGGMGVALCVELI